MKSILYIVFLKFSITASILMICLGCNEQSKKSVDTTVEPAPQTKTSQLDIAKVIVGYWVTQTGQNELRIN